ncbi:NAD(P)H-dependent oxidoreductase [Miniphocaeibacter halophilus]|uniref:NAD(P)-dependent oxidoreductase n=1 Tax=Miniphocaeibacter halophilus TaxID=2931922 RepID=A0AC61MS45_9FIRM|nr:NAD(P)-dependent oxidoreductase [Miniphocaeibacter halophilus]QQK08454.1 NAD(P)-dependent oxidoreductase [Miniphocaeibacter halophilus]
MFRMKNKLDELVSRGEQIRIALVGAGKMGTGLVNQISRIKGMTTSIIVDEKIDKAYHALDSAGIKKEDIIKTNSIQQAELALSKNKFVITDDYTLSYRLDKIQGVVDATGNPPFGAQLAMESIEHYKHIIMLNVECDAVVGPIIYDYARKNNVVYTGTAGDEPGAIMELANFAVGAGFNLLAVGKGKNNPLDNYATEDDLREEAISKGLYPKMLTAFVDGTNTMLELTSVANALGFTPDVLGCHGVTADIKEIPSLFSLKEQGGILNNYRVVDFCFGIAPGVFAVVTHDTKEVHDLMDYLSMGKGPNYVLYRPYHLTSLETPITIYEAIVEHDPTIAPEKGQVSDTITVAKRDLKAGQYLEGIGGKDVFGKITSHIDQRNRKLLPIALITKKTKLKTDVKKDELITYDMVELEEEQIITKLRKKQDELGL